MDNTIGQIMRRGDNRDALSPEERQIYNTIVNFSYAIARGECKDVERYFEIFDDLNMNFYTRSGRNRYIATTLGTRLARSITTPEMLWCVYRLDPIIFKMLLYGEDTILESWVDNFQNTVMQESLWGAEGGRHMMNTLLMIDYDMGEEPKLYNITEDDFEWTAYRWDTYFTKYFSDSFPSEEEKYDSQLNLEEAIFVMEEAGVSLEQLVDENALDDEALREIGAPHLLHAVDENLRDNPLYERQLLGVIGRYAKSPKRKRSP